MCLNCIVNCYPLPYPPPITKHNRSRKLNFRPGVILPDEGPPSLLNFFQPNHINHTTIRLVNTHLSIIFNTFFHLVSSSTPSHNIQVNFHGKLSLFVKFFLTLCNFQCPDEGLLHRNIDMKVCEIKRLQDLSLPECFLFVI